MSFCAFAQLVATLILFSAWDNSLVKCDNSRNSTQKMRTYKISLKERKEVHLIQSYSRPHLHFLSKLVIRLLNQGHGQNLCKLSLSTIIPKSALFWLLVATSVTEYYLMHHVGEVLYFLAKKSSIVVEALIRSNCTGWNYFWRNIVKVNILLEGHKNFKNRPLTLWFKIKLTQ